MPTYDYECPKGHRFEHFQSISAKPTAACPRCRKPAKRLIGAGGGFLFKGSGFYTTDYRSLGYKKQAELESKSKGSASSKEKPAPPKKKSDS